MKKKVIVVTGPESSGTRWITSVLSQSPHVQGMTNVGHKDPLDAWWDKDWTASLEAMVSHKWTTPAVLTRRSYPHGADHHIPNYESFLMQCKNAGFAPIVLPIVRSPLANMKSWVTSRSSVRGHLGNATKFYEDFYREVLAATAVTQVPFSMISYEGFLLEGPDYANAIYRWLGLPEHYAEVGAKNGNYKHYKDKKWP